MYRNLYFLTVTTCKQTSLLSIQRQCLLNVQTRVRGNYNFDTVVGLGTTADFLIHHRHYLGQVDPR